MIETSKKTIDGIPVGVVSFKDEEAEFDQTRIDEQIRTLRGFKFNTKEVIAALIDLRDEYGAQTWGDVRKLMWSGNRIPEAKVRLWIIDQKILSGVHKDAIRGYPQLAKHL